MTTLDLSGYTGSKTKRPEWQPLTQASLRPGYVVAFDQSLAATGWAVIRNTTTVCRVVAAGTIKTERVGKGHEDDLRRGDEQHQAMARVLAQYAGVEVVHESPPIGGKVKGMGTSSLLAALALRVAARQEGLSVTMFQAQSAKKVVTGDGNADKPKVARAVRGMAWLHGVEYATNQAICDALAVGLAYLAKEVTSATTS